MSLIVARKDGNILRIVSDTKLTYPNHETKHLKTAPIDGTLKSIIINPKLCISFAGIVVNAKDAIEKIKDTDSYDTVVNLLYEAHLASNLKTEFIICTNTPSLIIHEIKNSESRSVSASWIGDADAYNSFQESMLGNPNEKTESNTQVKQDQIEDPATQSRSGMFYKELNFSIEVAKMESKLLSKMVSAMDYVIEKGNLDSVGGFRISITCEDEFKYDKYLKLYRSNFSFEAADHAIGHGSAGEGAYSLNFIGSSDNNQTIALHVKQGHFGIIYHKNDKNWSETKVIPLDEVDFLDFLKETYGIAASFSTQDRATKFLKDGEQEFNNNNFERSVLLFEKLIDELKGKEKAKGYYFKGIALHYQKDYGESLRTFQKAIDLDTSYNRLITQFMNKMANKHKKQS